jgi:hypothetical protein
MTARLWVTLRVHGRAFSPRAAEARSGLNFSVVREPGEIVERGRYAGQPLPYGTADYISQEDEAGCDGRALRFFADAERLWRAARECGAEEAVLHLDFQWKDQCNLEFDASFVAAAHRLGLPVTITCWEAEATGKDGPTPAP